MYRVAPMGGSSISISSSRPLRSRHLNRIFPNLSSNPRISPHPPPHSSFTKRANFCHHSKFQNRLAAPAVEGRTKIGGKFSIGGPGP